MALNWIDWMVFLGFLVMVAYIFALLATVLYSGAISAGDKAYPYLMSHILPPYIRGIMMAALYGAVMSTLTRLHAASTIFTIDIYKKFFYPQASQRRIVRMGRITTTAFVVLSCI